MATIQLSEFVPSSIKFSPIKINTKGGKTVFLNNENGSSIMIELPLMKAPFGLSTFVDDKTGVTSYSIPLSLDDPEVLAKFVDLENQIVGWIAANSTELLGKPQSVDVLRAGDTLKTMLKYGKPKDGKTYAPTLNLKVLMKDGEIATGVYSPQRQLTSPSSIEKMQKIKTIINVNSIWRTPMGVGITVRAHQVLLTPSTQLKACAFSAEAGNAGTAATTEDDEYDE